MTADLPDFDPRIIEHYVERTYRKASAILLGSVTAGVMFGAVLGAMPLTSLGASWPIPRMFGFATMLAGALVGGIIGYTIGDTRAFVCRLQGQIALAQVSAAKNAAAALSAVRQIQELEAHRTAEPKPTPTPAPLAELRSLVSAPTSPEEPRLAVGSDLPLPPVTP